MAEKTQETIRDALHQPPVAEKCRPAAGGPPLLRRSPGGAPEPPPAAALPLLSEPTFRDRHHDVARGDLFCRLQRRYGNRTLQRLVQPSKAEASGGANTIRLRPSGPQGSAPESVDREVQRSRGHGHPMGEDVRAKMDAGFGRDFSGVRLHTDAPAGKAAHALGAEAFTTGRDVYFGHDRYQPATTAGRHLLAHELAHTVQQGSAPKAPQARLTVGPGDDLLEQEAEAVAERVVHGTPPAASLTGTAGEMAVQRQDEAPPTPPAAAAPESATEAADLVIRLGNGVRITAAELSSGRDRVEIDLTGKSPAVPGLALRKLIYRTKSKKGEIHADLNVPFAAAGSVKLTVDAGGRVTFTGRARLPVRIGALNDPQLDLTLDANQQIAAQLKLSADQIKPRGLPGLSVEGGGEVHLAAGKLGGGVNVKLVYAGLAEGDFHLGFEDGTPSGGGKIEVTQECLKGASASLQVVQGDLTADVTVPAGKITPPIPGLEVPEGTLQIIMRNGELSGAISGLRLVYRELGEGTLSGGIEKGRLRGTGELVINVPGIDPVRGHVGFRGGKLHGGAKVTGKQFPKSLPVKSGSIEVAIDEQGKVTVKATAVIELGGVGRGQLRGAYQDGHLDLGADVHLSVPGLEPITAGVDYVNGELEGELDVPIAGDKLAGIGGNLHVEYRQKKWKAEQQISYERDDGKLKGEVTLCVAQQDDGSLVLYGGGDVTAQLTSFLAGQLNVEILPEGTTKVSGAIIVTEPLELFPEKKADRELFNVSKNIPLWAILVAVIRLRGGVRGGVGPGQLRDVAVEGEYTGGEESQPSFVIHGELYIPAFAEAYLAFGAGLGLDVVLGSLTGGIEAVGTAGIYGAVSVLPEIAYRDGDYTIDGTATLAAAAKIKLGLDAWAEIEALWVTVWENTWQLGEWVWDVGPTLALQAKMSYTFGQTEPPSFELKTSDIDAERLIQDAMPKEGPKGSGAREALKNRAEWSGRAKGKGKGADQVPETAGEAKQAPAPKAPPRPPRKARPTGKGPPPKRAVKEKGGKSTPELEALIDKAAKEKAKKTGKEAVPAVPAPAFPPPTAQEIEINWANYLAKTKGRGIERRAFEGKMQAGEVYHPKNRKWTTLKQDYLGAYASLKEREKAAACFAGKMRGGYHASGITRDSNFDAGLETPLPDGSPDKPYPIHWPTQFLVSNFEDFTVSGGTKITKTPRQIYTFNQGGRATDYRLGVAGLFSKRMGVGKKVKRQASGRTPAKTAAEWDKWRRIGFQGGGATTAPPASAPPRPAGIAADSSLFRKHEFPNGKPIPNGKTYGWFIDNAPAFRIYQKLRNVDKKAFRTAARDADFDVADPLQIIAYVGYLNAKAAVAQSQRGVSGYEMQHVMPLFLMGPIADKPENMWPLSVSQHREGHRILAKQPPLKDWGLPTHHLERTELIGKWFIIRKHGSSL